jgi:hypothetical protein
MKKIEAIIVPGKLDAVRAELERRGMQATLTLTDVQQAEDGSIEGGVDRRRSPSPESGGGSDAIWSSRSAENK